MGDLLTLWLQKYPKKGWSDIADALRQMDKNDVADKIARQYILPSPGIYNYIYMSYIHVHNVHVYISSGTCR